MVGTKAGGQKAKKTTIERHGKDFYKRIGTVGGRNGHTGGFASNRALARVAGAKGGRISRRGPAKKSLKPNIKRPEVSEEAKKVIAKAFWALNKTLIQQNLRKGTFNLFERTRMQMYFEKLSELQVARVTMGDWQGVMEESFLTKNYRSCYRDGLTIVRNNLTDKRVDEHLDAEGLEYLHFLRDNPRAVYTACECYEYVTGENMEGKKIHEGTLDRIKK